MNHKISVTFLSIVFCFILLGPSLATDSDSDGLTDEEELRYYTNRENSDTDGDGYTDGTEVKGGYSPLVGGGVTMGQNDYDQDKLSDWLEGWFGSDIGKSDSDNDGTNDYDEVMSGYSPRELSTSTRFARRIEVDLSTQRLFYYVDKVKLLNIPVSTGNPSTPTPLGEFAITSLIPTKRYVGVGYDLPNVKWNMGFRSGGYYLHGAYWHNDFGKRTHSHGCINLRTSDAEMLYKYMDIGVPVMVTGTTPKRFWVGT